MDLLQAYAEFNSEEPGRWHLIVVVEASRGNSSHGRAKMAPRETRAKIPAGPVHPPIQERGSEYSVPQILWHIGKTPEAAESAEGVIWIAPRFVIAFQE